MFKLSVITDEISQDLGHACGVAREYGLAAVEIRAVWGKSTRDFSRSDANRMRGILDENELVCACLASPLFKCELERRTEWADLEILKRSVDVADILGAPVIRGFTFWKRGSLKEKRNYILDAYRQAAEIIEDTPFFLGIENEHSTYVATGSELGKFLDDLGLEKVKAVWDPGNSFFSDGGKERPYPEGYEACKRDMIHFHLKDADIDPASGQPRFVAVGEGEIDYRGQFKALVQDKYPGYVSLETHFRMEEPGRAKVGETPPHPDVTPAERASRKCLENILRMLEEI